jgi:hypothetical protein
MHESRGTQQRQSKGKRTRGTGRLQSERSGIAAAAACCCVLLAKARVPWLYCRCRCRCRCRRRCGATPFVPACHHHQPGSACGAARRSASTISGHLAARATWIDMAWRSLIAPSVRISVMCTPAVGGASLPMIHHLRGRPGRSPSRASCTQARSSCRRRHRRRREDRTCACR